jgi:hypothetical protein
MAGWNSERAQQARDDGFIGIHSGEPSTRSGV